MRRSSIGFVAGLAGLCGATAIGPAAAEDGAADPRQGEQVDSICFGRNINNFETIDGVDDAILLEKSVNRWYKADLIGACSYRELKWALSVAIDQRPAGGCVRRGDRLIFSRSAFGDFSFQNTTRCVITDIYGWDPDATAEEASAAETEQPSD